MKIIVTGASGHVGKVITKDLMLKGHDVIPVYRIAPKSHLGPSLVGDLSQNMVFDQLLQKPDLVIHTAAGIPLGSDDEKTAAQNRAMDERVIGYCYDKHVALIYTSTAYLYDLATGSEYLKEDAPVSPSGNYYVAKLESEKKITSALSRFTILRLSSPYGLNKRNDNVLMKFVKQALNGKDLILNGMGNKLQDFIHEDDIAYVVHRCITDSVKGIFNCVQGKSVSMKTLAETILLQIPESSSRITFSGMPIENENLNIRFSNTKLRSIGITPRVSLADGLAQIIRHYKNKIVPR